MLLIRYRDPQSERSLWIVPGGGLELNESEEECVRREMREETNLLVRVERLLLDDNDLGGIERSKTYLCQVESGTPSPGYEPEFPVPEGYGIIATGWFHLEQPEMWSDEVHQNRITSSWLLRIQKALGYGSNS